MKPKCMVCGKPCAPFERNTDGTYAHVTCLRPYLVQLLNPKGDT